MSKKISKRLAPLLCLLIIFSFLLSVSLSPSTQVSLAFSEYDGGFDYSTVMSEPIVEVGASPSLPLSESQLKGLKLYPGGVPFGVKFMTDGILIVGFCDIDTGTKKVNPSTDAGLKAGDRIISVNGKELISAEELMVTVENSKGKPLSIVYTRNGSSYTTSLTPAFCKKEGCYKTGIYVKDNGAGIGTVTYIDPQTLSFGGLGHGICESDSGRLVPIQRGSVMSVTINGAVKGLSGAPGEIKGSFRSDKTGTLLKNTDCGVYGVFVKLPASLPSEPLSLCARNELREGKAYIYCTLDSTGPQRYEIEISRIDRAATAGKCFTVKVTDPALLEKTGGIVQGMGV